MYGAHGPIGLVMESVNEKTIIVTADRESEVKLAIQSLVMRYPACIYDPIRKNDDGYFCTTVNVA